jgi:hypothetical protein
LLAPIAFPWAGVFWTIAFMIAIWAGLEIASRIIQASAGQAAPVPSGMNPMEGTSLAAMFFTIMTEAGFAESRPSPRVSPPTLPESPTPTDVDEQHLMAKSQLEHPDEQAHGAILDQDDMSPHAQT